MKAKSLYKRLEKKLLTICYKKWGSMQKVADNLGISYRAVRYKFDQYDIPKNDIPKWILEKPPEYWRKMKLWDEITDEEFKKYGIK